MSGMMGMFGGRMPDLSAMREKMFGKADTNADEVISLEEFQAAGKAVGPGRSKSAEESDKAFSRIDSDGDGKLSKEEFNGFFDQLSTELRSAMLEMQAMMSSGGKTGAPDPTAMFEQSDKDDDGSVSRAEFDEMRQSSIGKLLDMLSGGSDEDAFAALDRDEDGKVSQQEFQSMAEKMREKTAGGSSIDLMNAIGAYQNGSKQETDLTSILMKTLDGSRGQTERRA
jgi:Ca2+-binding EF-hand superfamily protein